MHEYHTRVNSPRGSIGRGEQEGRERVSRSWVMMRPGALLIYPSRSEGGTEAGKTGAGATVQQGSRWTERNSSDWCEYSH